jgi:NADPH:quinone reductase
VVPALAAVWRLLPTRIPSAPTRGIGELDLRTNMKAAWYEKQGAAKDVLIVGQVDDPQPHAGEVRIRVAFSGVNPGDVKKREDAFGVGMPYPRVIPHSDGSGTVEAVGDGVSREWLGRRVWCYGAQSYRPFGTAAQYTVVPLRLVVPLPEGAPLEQGACLGIPGITAHRAVHVGGPVKEAASGVGLWMRGLVAVYQHIRLAAIRTAR